MDSDPLRSALSDRQHARGGRGDHVVVVGVLAVLLAEPLGPSAAVAGGIGVLASVAAAVGYGMLATRMINDGRRAHHPRFPGEPRGGAGKEAQPVV